MPFFQPRADSSCFAMQLTKSRGVSIKTMVADLSTFEPKQNHSGSVLRRTD